MSLTCLFLRYLSASPVVIRVVPVVEVDQEVVIDDISDGGDTHKSRVLPVDSFQLHPNTEAAVLRDRQTVEQRERQILTIVRQVNRQTGGY